MPVKLTDTELVMMNAAARQRSRPRAAEEPEGEHCPTVAAKLITGGLVREIKAKKGAAVWRREEKIEQAYSLKLTAAGLKAMVANEDEAKPVVVCDASATVDRVSASATHRALHRPHRRFVITSLRNRQYSV